MVIKSVNKNNKILLLSFIATIVTLSLVMFVISYYPTLQITQHLPTSYNVISPDWIRFISPGSDKVTFMNLTKINQIAGNYNVFANDSILILSGFSTQITVDRCIFTVVALYPQLNSDDLALNILKLDSETYSALINELKNRDSTNYTYKNNILYKVTRSTSDSPAYVDGYVCLRDGYLLYSDGMMGMDLLKAALDNETSTTRLIDEPRVKAAFYILSYGEGTELAFSYSTFPYAVSNVTATSTIVKYEDNAIVTSNLFSFNSTEIAQQNLNKIKQANLNASYFQIIDNYIFTVAKYDKANLFGELRSL
jgi:hypothetical protein